mgnify:CR=1 FL=1
MTATELLREAKSKRTHMNPKHPTNFLNKVELRKQEELLDLMRRATANGTQVEVATAVAKDWHPIIVVDADGKINFVIGDR